MKSPAPKAILILSAAALLAASSASAVIVAFDFEGGTNNTQGWHRYGTTGTLSTASDSTFGTGNSLQIPAGTTAAIYNFSSLTLGNGDSLSIAFDFHFVTSAGTQGPRLFFGNQGDTVNNPPTDADTSYYTGIGTSSPSNSNYVYNGGTTATGVSIAASGGTASVTGTGTLAINDTNSHRIVYTITNNNGFYDFLTTIDTGGATPQQKLFSGFGVAAAATSNLPTFNTVGILQGSSGGSSYAIDNVTLTTVPEPTTFGLMGVSSLAAGLVRRRKQSV